MWKWRLRDSSWAAAALIELVINGGHHTILALITGAIHHVSLKSTHLGGRSRRRHNGNIFQLTRAVIRNFYDATLLALV